MSWNTNIDLDMIAKKRELLLEHQLEIARKAKDDELVAIRADIVALRARIGEIERRGE